MLDQSQRLVQRNYRCFNVTLGGPLKQFKFIFFFPKLLRSMAFVSWKKMFVPLPSLPVDWRRKALWKQLLPGCLLIRVCLKPKPSPCGRKSEVRRTSDRPCPCQPWFHVDFPMNQPNRPTEPIFSLGHPYSNSCSMPCSHVYNKYILYIWKPNDPCFGGFDPLRINHTNNRGHVGSR